MYIYIYICREREREYDTCVVDRNSSRILRWLSEFELDFESTIGTAVQSLRLHNPRVDLYECFHRSQRHRLSNCNRSDA